MKKTDHENKYAKQVRELIQDGVPKKERVSSLCDNAEGFEDTEDEDCETLCPIEYLNDYINALIAIGRLKNPTCSVCLVNGKIANIPTLILFEEGHYPEDLDGYLGSTYEDISSKVCVSTLTAWKKANHTNKGVLRPHLDPCCAFVVSTQEENIVVPQTTPQLLHFTVGATASYGFKSEVIHGVVEAAEEAGFIWENATETLTHDLFENATLIRNIA